MYEIFLAAHNLLRWIAFALVLLAAINYILGWAQKREWNETDRKLGLFATISLDVQLLLGLLLYFVYSPLTKSALQDFGAAMGITDLRFYAVEHALFMVLAVILAHVGSALAKKAAEPKAKFMRLAIFFGLALLLVLAGIPWGRPLFPGLG